MISHFFPTCCHLSPLVSHLLLACNFMEQASKQASTSMIFEQFGAFVAWWQGHRPDKDLFGSLLSCFAVATVSRFLFWVSCLPDADEPGVGFPDESASSSCCMSKMNAPYDAWDFELFSLLIVSEPHFILLLRGLCTYSNWLDPVHVHTSSLLLTHRLIHFCTSLISLSLCRLQSPVARGWRAKKSRFLFWVWLRLSPGFLLFTFHACRLQWLCCARREIKKNQPSNQQPPSTFAGSGLNTVKSDWSTNKLFGVNAGKILTSLSPFWQWSFGKYKT